MATERRVAGLWLFKVADDPASRLSVWGEHAEEDRPQVASQALANMLEVALEAVRRLPGFKKNQDSCCSYSKYMLERSPGVLEEILAHEDWWPELTPVAKHVKLGQAAQAPPAADGKTRPPGAHDS